MIIVKVADDYNVSYVIFRDNEIHNNVSSGGNMLLCYYTSNFIKIKRYRDEP